MYRDEFRRQIDARRARRSGRISRQPQAFRLLEFQIAVCVIAVAAALIIRWIGGGVYMSVKNGVSYALNEGITGSDIASIFKALKDRMPDASAIFSSSAAGSSSALSSSSSSLSSSQSSSSSSSPSSSSSSSSGSSAASNATGGQDLTARFSSNGLLLPPDGASAGPYLLSAQPIWPVEGNVSSGFGYRLNPITHKVSFHTGIDIASPEGRAIKAAMPGWVSEAGNAKAYGLYIILDHGNGVETFYGHCSKLLKTEGESVKAGEQIALVGMTGMATGYHLHFELRINKVLVDPLLAVKR